MGSIVFVEVPVTDIDRAMAFYGTIFDKTLEKVDDGVRQYATIGNGEQGAISMSITQAEGFTPSSDGPLIYLTFDETIDATLKRVEDAGGKIAMPKTSMGEFGFMATFNDTEGNAFGLYEAATQS